MQSILLVETFGKHKNKQTFPFCNFSKHTVQLATSCVVSLSSVFLSLLDVVAAACDVVVEVVGMTSVLCFLICM